MFVALLQHENAYLRTHLPGHMTGSAWIVNEGCTHVLLTHHAKLNRWLQPGGHADGDEDIIRVAMKEALEETGITHLKLVSEDLFDIDIHEIPQRKDFPSHDHYDIRFIIQADMNQKFTITEESHDLAWVPLEEVAARSGGNTSMVRMVEKTLRLQQK